MRNSFFKIIFVLVLVLLPFSYSVVFAGAGHNISGWAWSDNIGWISFNSTNDHNEITAGVQPSAVDYGVSKDGSGNLVGYAWSDNIGWIKFGGLSGFPSGSETQAQDANIDGNNLKGWARACAGTQNGGCSTMTSRTDGWDGWISLSGVVSFPGSGNYGVQFNNGTGNFSSYAWGSDVVGWIDWSGVVGSATTYTVTGTAGSNGTISPATQTVNSGSITTLIVTPTLGYIASASGCSGSLSGNTYTTGAITADCTVNATFSLSACANGATNPPACTICPAGSVMISGMCTPVTVSVTADTPYNTTPSTNIPFTYNSTTNSGTTECQLLDNAYSALSSYETSNPINHDSPSSIGTYTYYIQCRNTTTTSAVGISNPITVNVSADPNINGACSSPLVRFTCDSGTVSNKRGNIKEWKWNCEGTGTGSTASCSMPKKPPIITED